MTLNRILWYGNMFTEAEIQIYVSKMHSKIR